MRHRALPFGKSLAFITGICLSASLAGCTGDLRERGPGTPDDDAGGSGGADGGSGGGMDAGPGGSTDGSTSGIDAGSGGGTDAGVMGCGALTMCGTACIDTSTDTSNCGACGRACATDQTCAGGMCMGGAGCPGAPAGVSAASVTALEYTNMVRTAMGSPCVALIPAINTSAERHCAYYAANRSVPMCVSNPHSEVAGCSMFVAASFADRMRMAGYTGSPASEVMAFANDPTRSVQQWIDSVWHRTPVLSPWLRDMGYGAAAGCDTIDYGRGTRSPDTIVATYPYAGQTGVPTDFNGLFEGPTPPAPPTGWPSGYPIHIYIQGTITSHVVTVDGSTTPLDDTYLAPGDPRAMGLLSNEVIFYPHAPLARGTRYRVQATGTNSAGAVNLDWTFTTR